METEVRGPRVIRQWARGRGEAKSTNEMEQGLRPQGSVWGQSREGEEKGPPEDQS